MPLQQVLATATGVQAFAILRAVEKAEPGAAKYSHVIDSIEWGILISFLAAALYAGFHAAQLRLCFHS